MSNKMTYAEKLKHPEWQKKRLKIMERDGFKCMACYSKETTLHVHHRFYISGRQPWEYEDSVLVTLCEDCHKRNEGGDIDEKGRLIFERISKIDQDSLICLVEIYETLGALRVHELANPIFIDAMINLLDAFNKEREIVFNRGQECERSRIRKEET